MDANRKKGKELKVLENQPKTVSYRIVSFRYDKANSRRYKSFTDAVDVAKEVYGLLTVDGVDVISVRRVYTACPIPQEKQ